METRNLGGRPEIGPAFSVRFPPELLEQVDAAAAAEHTSRANWLRWAAQDRLDVAREELAAFVEWLLASPDVDNSEIPRVIEKPWSYQDWLKTFRAGGTLEELP